MRGGWLLALGLGCGAGPASRAAPEAAPGGPSVAEPAVARAEPTWLKGQLHAHTDRSGDSRTPPATALRWYAERGFHFVVVTDHNFVTVERGEGVLAIPGIELTQNVDACDPPPEPGLRCLLHVNALFVDPRRAGPWTFPAVEEPGRREIYGRALAATAELGGLAQLNHPNFHYVADGRLVADLVDDGVRLLEVANESIDVNNAGDATHPSTEALWDAALARRRRVFAVATDDAHHYDDAAAVKASGEEVYVGDRGWVMVRAKKEVAEIRAAIERGDFYATNGVTLRDVQVGEGTLAVTMGEVHAVRFIGAGGLVLAQSRGTSAGYALADDDGPYVRAEVTGDDGKKAWTQPAWREGSTVHVAEPMRGPYASVAAYCQELARETANRGDEEIDGNLGREACKPGGVTLVERSKQAAIRGAQALRIAANPFGAPLELCRLAIETERGWFISAELEVPTCKGVTGPLQTVKTSGEAWARVGTDGRTVAHTANVATGHGSHEPRPDGRVGRSEEQAYKRVLRLCHVGATGRPGCTGEIVTACSVGDERPHEATWKIEEGRLRISMTDREACIHGAPPESGPLVWP